MKILSLFLFVLGLMWFMFYIGSYGGRREGMLKAKRTYLDSAMKSDSIRWDKWDRNQVSYDRQYDSLIRVMDSMVNEK